MVFMNLRTLCIRTAIAFLLYGSVVSSATAQLTATLIVSVLDENTGQTIEGASVTLTPGPTYYSDSNGIAVFAAVITSGSHSVSVTKAGYDTDAFSVSLAPGELKHVYAELSTTYSLDPGPQFQVAGPLGTIVARFDQQGNLEVGGAIIAHASNAQLLPTSSKELLVKSGSTVVARLDSSGNLYLKGAFLRRLSSINLGTTSAYRVKSPGGTTVAAIDDAGNLRILGGSNGF